MDEGDRQTEGEEENGRGGKEGERVSERGMERKPVKKHTHTEQYNVYVTVGAVVQVSQF